jgi:cytidylate kinase
MSKEKISIAIDGPAGSGKSTVARKVAEALGLLYVDTGAMYRAVTLKALREKISLEDGEALTKLAKELDLSYRRMPDNSYRLFLDGEDVSAEIRTEKVSAGVSLVATVKGVRRALVERQKQLGVGGNVVMDGRDIGSTVLPEADYKIFLTASVKERARRRWLELQGKKVNVTLEEIEESIRNRDHIDSNRETDPLRPTPGCLILDTTDLDIDQVVGRILETIGTD